MMGIAPPMAGHCGPEVPASMLGRLGAVLRPSRVRPPYEAFTTPRTFWQ
jgi:hypothetical protein